MPPRDPDYSPHDPPPLQHDFPIPPVPHIARVQCQGPCGRILAPTSEWFYTLEDPYCRDCRDSVKERALLEKYPLEEASRIILGEYSGGKPKLPHIEEFLGELMIAFGGMKPFVKRWYDEFEKSLNTKQGSRQNLDHFRAIVKLVKETNMLRHEEDVKRMTDEQIRREQQLALVEMLGEMAQDKGMQPVLAAILKQNGMAVELIEQVEEARVGQNEE